MTGRVYYSLYDRLLHEEALLKAFKQVKSSKGRGGVDHQDLGDFNANLSCNIRTLVKELKEKTYHPDPVLRVKIPKGKNKVRLLGIPTVRDRVVQQALLNILQPIYEEDFHPSSYGYRPNRGCHQAVCKAAVFIREYDLRHVVDMDLSRCFDTLNHDLIIRFLRKRVTDGGILSLIRKFLECGVLVGDEIQETKMGSPQGGVISPLLANIYLNEFDQFMKERNYRIVRYADDILILCQSRRSAEHALEVASAFLEKDLKLIVNQEKTHIAHCSEGINFLGFKLYCDYTRIQEKKIKDFKEKVKALTKKNQGVNLQTVIWRLNPLLRGFAFYFRVANCSKDFRDLMSWIRRRLRAIQLKLWKKPEKLQRRMRQLGYSKAVPKIRMDKWHNSNCFYVDYSMPNSWFVELNLFNMYLVRTGLVVPI